MSDIIKIARNVINIEINGLEALKADLGADFANAAQLILTCKNRLIVSGMGKSGHIGAKIAASLASVGTPSFFIHPAEASHGDLGMICQGDILLALSNSGETTELGDLLAFCERNAIKVIAITSHGASTLARMADVALILPQSPEACPLDLAPTTSTTMMLALGDALAVSLLEQRKFTPEDFANFHPGGKLGQRLLKVSDIMHQGKKMPLVTDQCPMGDAIVEMSTKSFGCSGVVDHQGNLLGIITDGDLRRWLGDNGALDTKVADVMNANIRTISPNILVSEALDMMNHNKITSLFISDTNNKPLGILHIHDCLRSGLQ